MLSDCATRLSRPHKSTNGIPTAETNAQAAIMKIREITGTTTADAADFALVAAPVAVPEPEAVEEVVEDVVLIIA